MSAITPQNINTLISASILSLYIYLPQGIDVNLRTIYRRYATLNFV